MVTIDATGHLSLDRQRPRDRSQWYDILQHGRPPFPGHTHFEDLQRPASKAGRRTLLSPPRQVHLPAISSLQARHPFLAAG